jgi:hypothetical protein
MKGGKKGKRIFFEELVVDLESNRGNCCSCIWGRILNIDFQRN